MRTRNWPLVPAKLEEVIVGPRQDNATWIQKHCVFVPNLDVRDSVWELLPKRRKEILLKAKMLSEQALENLSDKVSEDRWDQDAGAQVFGSIRNDRRLRVEKKMCYYLLEGDRPSARVKVRRPDQTFGLASYDDRNPAKHAAELKQGNYFSMQAASPESDFPNSLFKSRLLKQVYCDSTGLVVDGLWGDVDLVFPWGVYEAKKTAHAYKAVVKQVFRAARIYLGMLDDLARSPDNTEEYQTPISSSRYQVFLFTSCGPIWEVWIACNQYGRGVSTLYSVLRTTSQLTKDTQMVDRIWSGNTCKETKAYDLLCIMDQIHNYAVTKHRDFVVEHLQAWLQRAELDACLPELSGWKRDRLLKYEKYPKGCYPPEWLKKLRESNLVSHGKSGTPEKQRTPSPNTAGVSKKSLRKKKAKDDRHIRNRNLNLQFLNDWTRQIAIN